MPNKKLAPSGPITDLVRELRRNATPSEKKLWQAIRNFQIMEVKFRRQHPIFYAGRENPQQLYVPDFYCVEAKLVIELDGAVHRELILEDAYRDEALNEMGIAVLRFQNAELENLQRVLEAIRFALHGRI
jgi:very-short-patch-repair endonuclease